MFEFDIPSQAATAALNLLGRQSNQQILYLYDEVLGISTQAVEGRYTLDAAIDRMLAGTGLVARRNERGVVTVSPVGRDPEPIGGSEMSPTTRRRGGLFAAIAAAFANSGNAQDTEAEQTSGFALEEVVVTARRVEENVQEVPVSISAFTADTLERRQITGTDDLGKITPNLQFTNNAPLAGNNNSSVVFIRGVGQISARANTDPGVGLYIDEVYMGQSVGGSMEMYDIASVQVLRGPQGALFGRNTLGGAVLLTTT